MALAPIEVLIYALVITGNPVPTDCSVQRDKSVLCTNGLTATQAVNGIVYEGKSLNGKKIMVQYARDGSLLFSNGISASRTSAGWIKFSNGVEARRDMSGGTNMFLVAPDLVCSEISSTQATCKRR
ncbi:MAG TPA: hypothetical protein VMH36_17300 [Alphaproteobacteria bacterium]|nr:hypothetical protein [Alphaproteobacteria bacterium]